MNLHEISLSGGQLAGVMRAVLEKGARFRFRARGFSMSPFIRDNDVLTLAPAGQRKPEVGDVAAAAHPLTGRVIVHRIVGRQRRGFIFKGDNCIEPDGIPGLTPILGVVCEVSRNGKTAWFAGGPEKRLIAFISRTGILNRVVLPVLRRLRRGIDPGMRLNNG